MASEYSRRSVLGAFGGAVDAAPRACQSFGRRPGVTGRPTVQTKRATLIRGGPGGDFLVAGQAIDGMGLARYEPDGRPVWRRCYPTDDGARPAAGSFVTRLRGGATGDAPGGTDGS